MKKGFLFFLIICTLVFGVVGCQKDDLQNGENNGDNGITTNENVNNKKEVLELEDYRNNPISLNFEEDDLVKSQAINLKHTTLKEQLSTKYNNEREFDVLAQYIKDNFNIEINNNWKVYVHYYDTEKTSGIVEFTYSVGEINTNRSFSFTINNSKYDKVSYKCLTENIDEKNLIDRVNIFKEKYVQEKKDLSDDEVFFEENTNYMYYINADKLIYSYTYFYKYDEAGFINNDWGTIRLIDENGNAILLR